MKKRIPSLIIAGLLIIFCALAITQRPQGFYTVIEVEVSPRSRTKPAEIALEPIKTHPVYPYLLRDIAIERPNQGMAFSN